MPSEIDVRPPASTVDAVARRTQELGPGISLRLKQVSKLRGLTTRELAVRAHTSHLTVINIRKGMGGNSGLALLVNVAYALKVRPCWLFFGEEPMEELPAEKPKRAKKP